MKRCVKDGNAWPVLTSDLFNAMYIAEVAKHARINRGLPKFRDHNNGRWVIGKIRDLKD